MKKLLFICVALLALAGCKKTKTTSVHPDWTYSSVMYEVNIRQFSPEGTFAGVEAQLPRLKELGVDILWLMPMYEIGTEGRKGTLGSYYAISDYKKVPRPTSWDSRSSWTGWPTRPPRTTCG